MIFTTQGSKEMNDLPASNSLILCVKSLSGKKQSRNDFFVHKEAKK
jgi:hypothetical protein